MITAATLIVLVSGILVAFAAPLSALVGQWDADPMYSHGYVVPIISLYLLWMKREALAAAPVRGGDLRSLALVSAALLLLIAGDLAAVQVVQQIGFIVAIAGVVAFVFGFAVLRVCIPPIAYLLFMIPLWEWLTDPLHWPFQVGSAKLGTQMMRGLGVPAYLDATRIHLPNVVLEVARECSGVNYLIAVIAVALPVAWLNQRRTWRRVVLVTSAVLIAALANGLRVGLIGTLAYHEVGAPLHGPFHVLHGLFVSAVGYGALFVGAHVLREAPSQAVLTSPPPRNGVAFRTHHAIGLAVLFWAVSVIGIPAAAPVALVATLESLPARLGDWHQDPPEGPAIFPEGPAVSELDHADRRLRRVYSADQRPVLVDVWYFESQSQRREIVNASTAALHRQSSHIVVTPVSGQPFKANVFRASASDQLGIFWYELAGVQTPQPLIAKIRAAWNRLRYARNDGATIMLRTRLDADREASAVAALQSLAAQLRPELSRIWRETSQVDQAPMASFLLVD